MAKLEGSVLGFLNLDDDERLVPKGDYVDALNIRKTISSGGIPSPAYNVLGNTLVNYSLPAGVNTCVGAIVHEETNNLFYFVHNTLSDHSILQYNTITGNITLVAQDSFLNLKKNAFVTGQAINAIDDSGVLLYFTDNINPPRKINVKRAILHQQGDFSNGYATEFSSGTDAQKAQFYDHIKHPPSNPPSFEFITDNTKQYNNIRDKVFQFRYRYIYDDNEVSTLSPWTQLVVSDYQLYNDDSVAENYNYQDNGIRLTIDTTQNCVSDIEITFREGNNGDEYVIKKFKNSPENSTFDFDFFNDAIYSLINTLDAVNNYSAVPILAKDFKIKGERGFFGNVLDGYDNTDVDVNISVGYNDDSEISNETIPESGVNYVFVPFGNLPISDTAGVFSLYFGNITIEIGKVIVLDFIMRLRVSTEVWVDRFNESYIIQPGDTLLDIVDYFESKLLNFENILKIPRVDKSINYLNIFIYPVNISVSRTFDGAFSIQNFSRVLPSSRPSSSFKAGAHHPFAIIYNDRGGRVDTANKAGEVYVKWYSERNQNTEGLGSTYVGLSINNTPPVWAESYQILYGGNTTVDEFLQFTCVGAYKSVSNSNKNDRLYISMRNFKGEDKSYKNSKKAIIDYNFVEGDRVRIRNYYDPSLNKRVNAFGYLDFKVVGFELLDKDSDTNPIYNSSDPIRTSGYFLILEDPKIDNWDTDGGSNLSNGYWYNTSGEGAYFEIYRRKPVSSKTIYYEIGEKYKIANAGTSSRYHEGGIRNQNETISYGNLVPESGTSFNYLDANTTTNKFVVGDVIELLNNSALQLGVFTIERVEILSDRVRLYINQTISYSTIANGVTINLISNGAATVLDSGDVWYKPRTFFTKNNTNGFDTDSVWVEDYYVNDFIDSDSWDRGRVWAYSEDNKQIRRKASLYFTQPFFSDTNFNGLSTIYLSQTPFFDYDQSFGSIQAIRSHNDGLVLWKENKVSLAPVDRRIIESTDGGQISTASDTVLSQERFYAGDYGIGLNPESLSGGDGRWYWLDPKRGKFLRLSNDGITPVSDYKMRSYFYRETKLYQQNYGGAKFFGGYDRENEEAIITFPQVTSGAIVVTPSQTPVISPLPNSTEVSGNIYTTVDIQQGTPKTRTWSSETRTWAEIDETWDEWGGAEYDTSEIAERGIVEVPADKISNSAEPIYVTYKTATGDVVARGTLNIDESRIEVPTTGTDPAHPIAVTTTTAGTAECVAFYEPANRWSTFYSFTPEMFAVISNIFVSWKDGALYVHNGNTTRNNFYGVQYNSEISPIVNDAPYDAKMFFAAGLESTTTWDAVFTTDLNTASADETRWVDKEGTYYTDIPMCYSGTTVSNIIGLSDVVDVTGNNVEVARYTTNGLFVGDVVYNSGTSIGTITAIDSDTNILTLTSSGSLSSGDYVYVQRNLQIEGDRLRGVYCRIDLTSDDTTETELYKIDLEAKKSYI